METFVCDRMGTKTCVCQIPFGARLIRSLNTFHRNSKSLVWPVGLIERRKIGQYNAIQYNTMFSDMFQDMMKFAAAYLPLGSRMRALAAFKATVTTNKK